MFKAYVGTKVAELLQTDVYLLLHELANRAFVRVFSVRCFLLEHCTTLSRGLDTAVSLGESLKMHPPVCIMT